MQIATSCTSQIHVLQTFLFFKMKNEHAGPPCLCTSAQESFEQCL